MSTQPIEKVTEVARLKAYHGDIPVQSLYTVGVAAERFLRTIKKEARFTGTRCGGCGLTYVPATLFCERCMARLEDWVDLPDTGTLESFTWCHGGRAGKRLKKPAGVGAVRLEGASTCLIAPLGEMAPGDTRIGMRVKAVFRGQKDRKGSILDVRHFRPEK